jgi:hypothetical protein
MLGLLFASRFSGHHAQKARFTMRYELSIECDNAAFGESSSELLAEVARILRVVAGRCEDNESSQMIRDLNGNTVGAANLLISPPARKAARTA